MESLEILCGSKERVHLMRFFLLGSETPHDLSSLVKKTSLERVLLKKEIKTLLLSGFLKTKIYTKEEIREQLHRTMDKFVNLPLIHPQMFDVPLFSALSYKFLKNVGFSEKEIKALIEISEDLTFWQDERKRSSFLTTHYLSKFLEEKPLIFTLKSLSVSWDCLK